MHPIIKEIEDLRYSYAMYNFQDYISREDEAAMKRISDKIDELYLQLKEVDKRNWVCLAQADDDSWYFTGDKNVCCSESPTWFESEKEAFELLSVSDVKHKRYELLKFEEADKINQSQQKVLRLLKKEYPTDKNIKRIDHLLKDLELYPGYMLNRRRFTNVIYNCMEE